MLVIDWVLTIIRTTFMTVDAAIFILIRWLFEIVYKLVNYEFIGLYETFESNIYIILSIFMLFKVTVSMLTYLVNPDKISDKQEGASKLVTRIILSMVMLILLPTFFDLTSEFQDKALNALPRVIMANQVSTTKTEDTIKSTASEMTLTLMQGLAQKHCKDAPDVKTIEEFIYHINDTCPGSDAKNEFVYGYIPIIPTLVGAFILFSLFSMCIQLAVRVFKLLILRMIAPIPIISYIDYKSSKDGMFAAWVKLFFQTWLEVFINMGVIYIVVYIIGFIISFNGEQEFGGILFTCFLIIGLLMFARKAPDFIYDALGIKSKQGFVRMLGMGAAAVGGVGTAIGAYRARTKADAANGIEATGRRNLMNFGASLFNGLASMSQGGHAVLSSEKGSITAGIDAQKKYNVTNRGRIFNGETLFDRASSYASSIFLGEPLNDSYSLRDSALQGALGKLKGHQETIEKRTDGNYDFQMKDSGTGQVFNWAELNDTYQSALSGNDEAKTKLAKMLGKGIAATDSDTVRAQKITDSLDYMLKNQDRIHKDAYEQFSETVLGNHIDAAGNYITDSVVIESQRDLDDAIKGVVVKEYDSGGMPTGNEIILSQKVDGRYKNTKQMRGSVTATTGALHREAGYKRSQKKSNS